METTESKEIGFSEKQKTAFVIAEKVKYLVVTNAQEHEAAGAMVDLIRKFEKDLETEYKNHPIIIKAKEIQATKSELATMLETARKTAKGRQMAWEDQEEAKRVAEEARLAKIAKQQADNEALERARIAQDEGNHAEAAEVLKEAIEAPAPVVVIPKTAPKAVGRRMVPKFRIINEGLIPRQYLSPDMVKIGGVIRSLKSSANIPGVQYYEEAA